MTLLFLLIKKEDFDDVQKPPRDREREREREHERNPRGDGDDFVLGENGDAVDAGDARD